MTYMRVALAESTISFNGISTTNKDGKGTGNKPAGRQSTPSIAPPCFSPRFVQDHSYPLSSDFQSPRAVPEVLDSMTSTAITTTRNIVRLASQVIFYLSASNWSSVFSRIRTRISYFTTTIEEVPDLVDLRLLEWSNVDRVRLGQVIHEISSAFLNVKRPAQIALAIVLRKAIWTWISVHPIEYENLVESNRNIEGGPDILFDILFSLSDASSASSVLRAKSYHPLMAMLLVLCPDTLKRSTSRETSGRSGVSFTKRMTFLGNIRKGLANSKAFEGCVACYVDFMKAAMSLAPKWESSGVRSFVPDFQNDLKVGLCVSTRTSADFRRIAFSTHHSQPRFPIPV